MKRLYRSTCLILSVITVFSITWLSLNREKPQALPRGEKAECNAGVNHAILIGISQYEKWEPLKSPAKDAEEVGRILISKYNFKKENVVLLTDNTKESPTRANILNHLDRNFRELTPSDNLLIFYTGHSYEDENGETYWVPRDGEKSTKLTWLRHTEICREFFASPDLKAKNLCIISDSAFSNKLFVPKMTRITLDDLRYEEKICERSTKPSREVIAFGDRHWYGAESTKGSGILAYCLLEAMTNNWMKLSDFENLLFNEKAVQMASKIAGTRMIRGRLKNTPKEEGGQSVITRTISPPKINVVESDVKPGKGYAGDQFYFKATTDYAASEVYLHIDGRQYLMEGNDREWRLPLVLNNVGALPFEIKASNMDGDPGMPKRGEVLTSKKEVGKVNVAEALVAPKEGVKGSEYRFTATTDSEATSVILFIQGKPHAMAGKGTEWSFQKRIDDTGTLDFSVVATNKEGDQGRSKGAVFLVKEQTINIVEVQTAASAYFGETVLIKAKSDRPAALVELEMDGRIVPMTGKGTEWRYEKKLEHLGKTSFTVAAKNSEGVRGIVKTGELLVDKRPSPLADVGSIDVTPQIPFADDPVRIVAKTSAPAEKVFVEIDGKRQPMTGSGTEWKYEARFVNVGTNRFGVVALNDDGNPGLLKHAEITVKKRPLPIPEVASITVNPQAPKTDEIFAIHVKTNVPAEKVHLLVEGRKELMQGKGTEWRYDSTAENAGKLDFEVLAENKDGEGGRSAKRSISIAKRVEKAVAVAAVEVTPRTGLPGDEFTFRATTSDPAASVTLVLEDNRYDMTGSGTEWSFKRKMEQWGRAPFTAVARNADGVEGASKRGSLVIKDHPADIESVTLSKEKVLEGEKLVVTAKTIRPAAAVFLESEGTSTKMKGQGTEWRLERQFDEAGTKTLVIMARNLDNVQGPSKTAEIVVASRPVPVPEIAAVTAPGETISGEPFSVLAKTTEPASKVYIELDGQRHPMSGSDKAWEYSGSLAGTGAKRFQIIAANKAGQEGGPKGGVIQAKERPSIIPDVTDVKVSAVSPGEGYVGDNFLVTATTNNPSESVIFELGGKQVRMEGSGRVWKVVSQIERLGENPYKVVALDKVGKHGLVKEGRITTRPKPKALINVVEVDVSPKKGQAGQEFLFKARTDGAAKAVTLLLGNERLEMSGSGDVWSLKRKIQNPGSLVFSMVAKNQEDIEGSARTAELSVEEVKQRYASNQDGTVTDVLTGKVNQRFIDNKNGTVTDLVSGLMWVKSPKQVAMTWEEAVQYCQQLNLDGQTGWRLPTIEEWTALVDKSRQNPALPSTHPFSNVLTHVGYWSKTRHQFGPLYVHEMNLWYGKSGYQNKTKTALVWPVRYTSLASR
ncbi:MAG: hypothetical protein CVU64_15010 [Deltaproteobacteria bacterium HGW-Deltaproteobacteria-21]|nr:MAG: hypothetical protein CVU64_15010 [Deltaproteobacteria bacterium HGW-Deltaproteobacteria-21]